MLIDSGLADSLNMAAELHCDLVVTYGFLSLLLPVLSVSKHVEERFECSLLLQYIASLVLNGHAGGITDFWERV